ncbi:type IV secretory system conjugative DNA transfer family protein [Microbacterium lacticum]
MSGPIRPTGSLGDELTNAALAGLAALAVVTFLLRAAGSITAFLMGLPQPRSGITAGVAVLLGPGDPAEALDAPGLNAVVYWAVAGVLILGAGAAGWWGWRMVRNLGQEKGNDPARIVGVATRAEVARAGSPQALLRRAGNLRPSLGRPAPGDVGYRLGLSRGVEVWASVEDSILLIGPPRSGKGLHVVINAILDAPGAVVTTSTRPDNVTATIAARQDVGPVAVFDPQHLAEGIPAGLRWSPVRGCTDPLTAMIRAGGLASATGLGKGSVEGGDFWEAKTRVALQCLLHAAALDDRQPADLFRWTLDPAAAGDAVSILAAHPRAAGGWAESLQAMLESDPRTRDSIWQGVSLALAALADPRVLDAVTPGADEQFDPEAFLEQRGTLYLLATAAGANNSAPLVAALIEDVVEAARRLAARSTGARLDPPLLLPLDEIANLSPLPSLPTLMAEGGGTGITTMPVVQSLAQARERWSEHAASAIWDAAIVKIILGGASNSRDLQDLSTLIGERDEITDSTTVGDQGSRSAQRSIRRVSIMPPDTIRRLPFGTALVLLRAAPPIVTRLRRWTDRRDGRQLAANRAAIEAQLRRPADTGSTPAAQHRSDAQADEGGRDR